MHRTKSLAAVFLLPAIMSTFSCSEKGVEQQDFSFELSATTVDVPADGGQASMPYVLKNPLDTASIRPLCEAVWISRLEDNGHEIAFFVDANGADSSRSAEVKVYYAGDIRTFTVVQDGSEPKPDAFSITINETGTSTVKYSIAPYNKDMTYLYSVSSRSYWDDLTPEETPMAYIEDELEWYRFVAGYSNMTLEEYLAAIVVTGDISITKEGLDADRDYVVYAFGITADNLDITSDLYYEYFKTEDVMPSDNNITVSITNIKGRSADIEITTSNNDTYIYGADIASNWADMSGDEILSVLLGDDYDLSANIKSGNFSGTFWNLYPETEYIVFVFGYEAGKATTELITEHFKTTSSEQADATFDIEWGPCFDIDEIVETYPELSPYFQYGAGRAYVPMYPLPSAGSAGYYWLYYYDDRTDADQYSDITLIDELYYMGFMDAYANYVDYDMPGTIVGVCYDEEYVYGPIYRELLVITKDDISPIEDFPIEDFYSAGGMSAVPYEIHKSRTTKETLEAGLVKAGFSRESYR